MPRSEVKQEYVPLVEFCHQHGLDYYDTWRSVVTGGIPAKRVGSRWLVRRDAARGPPEPALA